jgi:DHHC palmitoyltransferase
VLEKQARMTALALEQSIASNGETLGSNQAPSNKSNFPPSSPSKSLKSTGGAGPQSPRTPTATTRRRKKQYAVSTRWEREVAENGPIKDFHRFFCCCARRLGNMFILCERADGSPVVIAGPCWPFCMFVTLPLILAVSGAVAYFMIISSESPLPLWVAYIYFPVLGFVLASLFCVSCQDPGLMERVTDEEAGEGGWFWNEQVGSFRPPGSLYCRECGVLIQDYDHLCPWTGTGIGRRNMMAFKLFVVGVNVLCYFSIILVIVALLRGLRN